MSTLARASLLVSLLGPSLAVCSLGCSRSDATAADASGVPSPNDAALKTASAPADAGRGDAGALSAAARATVLRDLNEGRKLSRAKDWTGAIKAFDHALTIAPDDARVLSEVGWAALQANDLPRAERANRRALANTKDAKLRASILYNAGRVAEARGDKVAAGKAYAASLALRDNAEVKKRVAELDACATFGSACLVSHEAGAPPSDGTSLSCKDPVASVDALCTCLRAHKDDVMAPDDAKLECKKAPSTLLLADARLSVVTFGAEMLGETVHLLTVREGDRMRAVAELGRDYEPGAFGIHNAAEVKGAEKRTVNGHEIVVVRSVQDDADSNMAGLELCTHLEKLETVCAVGTTPGATTCVTVPVEIDGGCGTGVEPEPNEVDDDMRREMAEIKKNATHSHVATSWSVANDGKLTVTVREGSRDLLGPNVLRPHALW